VQDVIYLLIAVGFFALSWWLVGFAGRLEKSGKGEEKS
jgi:hypothetical protein